MSKDFDFLNPKTKVMSEWLEGQQTQFRREMRWLLEKRYPTTTYVDSQTILGIEVDNIIERFGPQSADWVIEAASVIKERLQSEDGLTAKVVNE